MPVPAGVEPEFYDLALAVLKHRLHSVQASWHPPILRAYFVRTIPLGIRCAFVACVKNAFSRNVYDDDDIKIKLALMGILMEERQFMYLLLAVFAKGIEVNFADNATDIHFCIIGIAYWACGMATFLKDCRFRMEATYLTAALLALTIQHWAQQIDEQGGWVEFVRLRGFLMDTSESVEAQNVLRSYDSDLRHCFLKIPAGSTRELDFERFSSEA